MNSIKHKTLEARILNETGHSVQAEDHSYELKPISWYLKEPWFGMKKYFYTVAALDCDDFCTILKHYWLMKHLKKAESENGSHPALPVFQAKVEIGNGIEGYVHWCMVVVAQDGVYFVERTEENIRLVHNIQKVYRIHI